MKKTIIYIISSVLLFTTVIFILEGALRIYNSNGENYDIEMWKYSKYLKRKTGNRMIGIEHIPLKKCKLQNVNIEINSRGFRDREYQIPKPRDVYRIMVLGSSVTLGWGVPMDQTYVKLVEEWLEGNTGNKRVEIINTAVGNYNTTREIEAFFAKCLELNPDMVILTFFINDPQIIEIKENPVLKHSQLAVLLWSRYQQIIRIAGLKENYADYYKNLYTDKNHGWIICQQEMQKLANYCRNQNMYVLLAMIPDIHNLQNYPFEFAHQIIKTKSLEYGFHFLDFYNALKREDAVDLWAMRGDPHPNVKGHSIMARYLFEYLTKNKPWEHK